MQDLDNAGPGKCMGSKMPDFVAKNQQIFVVELYNYLEQVTYMLLLIVKQCPSLTCLMHQLIYSIHLVEMLVSVSYVPDYKFKILRHV